MEALATNALLHRDMATFDAMAAGEASLAYLKQHARTLLERACSGNRAEVAARLLQLDGIDSGADARGDTLLHIAAGAGSADVVRLLLARPQAPDQLDANGETALHAACRAGHDSVVRQLLEAGAEAGIANAAAQTAVDLADGECSPETLRLLEQHLHAGLPALMLAMRV